MLFNLKSHKIDNDKIYLYAKYLSEGKYQLLMNKRKCTALKHFNDPKAFTEYSYDMNDIYKSVKAGKGYYVLVIQATLASDNLFRFPRNLSARI